MTEQQINGHKNRTIRARKMWEKWRYLLEVKNWPVNKIAKKFKRDENYVSRKIGDVRKLSV